MRFCWYRPEKYKTPFNGTRESNPPRPAYEEQVLPFGANAVSGVAASVFIKHLPEIFRAPIVLRDGKLFPASGQCERCPCTDPDKVHVF